MAIPEVTYTRQEVESGVGRYVGRQTTIIQHEDCDEFMTLPAESGWRVAPGWHVAGSISIGGRVTWCDLWREDGGRADQ